MLPPPCVTICLQVAERIGKGAYGGVWQATVLDTKEEVVVKVVWPDADLDPEDAKTESPVTFNHASLQLFWLTTAIGKVEKRSFQGEKGSLDVLL